MANINADEHSPHRAHDIGELHLIKVSAHLTVYLAQDV